VHTALTPNSIKAVSAACGAHGVKLNVVQAGALTEAHYVEMGIDIGQRLAMAKLAVSAIGEHLPIVMWRVGASCICLQGVTHTCVFVVRHWLPNA
jgi:hypothetical protein